jgi:hypothetical protein
MTEREIDSAIDRAVRDLMNVDTDAAFRARVTARLQPPARRQLLRPLAAVALTATACAAAFLWMRPSSSPVPASAPLAGITSPPPAATTQRGSAVSPRPAPLPSPPPTVSARVRRATASPIQRGAVVAAVAEVLANDIAPLTAIDPIVVQPLAQEAIVPSEIVVAPLSPISDVQISPLEPRTARD